ncbi:nuclear cap-binding protein subunit 2 [Angomonas deanei]|nr:nuclear cap-binding protein subunit 2 [Angomonas deanei]|eukprot:EPY43861.1 nuclear cap-binding protein subunit 2 [Angomonas deanei]
MNCGARDTHSFCFPFLLFLIFSLFSSFFSMAHFLVNTRPTADYVDRRELLRSRLDEGEFKKRRQPLLNRSATVYVGNLSFYTSEEQLRIHFLPCGPIRDLVMGLNEQSRTPCGFSFIVFETTEAAAMAVLNLSGTLLDDRVIRVSWDVGCDPTRRWGRGAEGGQVVDAVRHNLDEGRGGLGSQRRNELQVGVLTEEEELLPYTWVTPPVRKRKAQPVSGGDGNKRRRV